MSLVDKHFKDAIRDLPEKKLSWAADRRLRKMIKQRARQLDGVSPIWTFFRQMALAPVALAVLLVVSSVYGFYSPAVVQGDMLYAVKTWGEDVWYPTDGSSEDRIAYHLWLSDRRYSEIDEILSRLGKNPLALIPAAHAQEVGSGSELDQLLLETLQRASQHVDYALLITDEIREVERVKVVKDQIKETVTRQKELVVEIVPVLEEVRLEREEIARKKKVETLVKVTEQDVIAADETGTDTETEAALRAVLDADTPADEAPVDVPEEELFVPLEELMEAGEDIDFTTAEVKVLEEDQVLETVGDLIEDRLAFQEEVLDDMEQTVAQAALEGKAVVRLEVTVELVPVIEKEAIQQKDKVFKKALVKHYREEKRLIAQELRAADPTLIADAGDFESLELAQELPELTDVEEKIETLLDESQEGEGASEAAEETVELVTVPEEELPEIAAVKELPVADLPAEEEPVIATLEIEDEEPVAASVAEEIREDLPVEPEVLVGEELKDDETEAATRAVLPEEPIEVDLDKGSYPDADCRKKAKQACRSREQMNLKCLKTAYKKCVEMKELREQAEQDKERDEDNDDDDDDTEETEESVPTTETSVDPVPVETLEETSVDVPTLELNIPNAPDRTEIRERIEERVESLSEEEMLRMQRRLLEVEQRLEDMEDDE